MGKKQFLNPPGMKALGMYSQVTTARDCTMVYISGQVAVDGNGKTVGAGDIQAQAVQVFENLKLALQGAGAGFADVVKFTFFIVDLTPDKRKAVVDVRSRYISKTHPPAATMIGVDKLVQDDLMLEIEAVAAVEK
jgi:enamine deaminase RidA (YjgF/YER057c/UK114 family)